jgi:hypothetical protein
MAGEELMRGLKTRVAGWDEIAVPERGRYVPEKQDG